MPELYVVTVDYKMSVEEAVGRGNYNWADPDITSKNFPMEQKGKVKLTVELISLCHRVSTEEALKELDQMGYRPAELLELLALGAQYPNLQTGPIVALGSVWQDLSGQDRVSSRSIWPLFERYLSLRWAKASWPVGWWFAAIRK